MRISLINVNLVAHDAIGQCIINQWRFFTRRGDEVMIYTEHAPTSVDEDIAAAVRVVDLAILSSGQDMHFNTSDLYVYHYPSRYLLMETMAGVERGSVIFYFHNVTPPALWDNPADHDLLQHSLDGVSTFAKYADLTVTDSAYNAQELIHTHGCAVERIRVLPLAVPIEAFSSQPKPVELIEAYGLAEHKVLLFVGRQASNKRVGILIKTLAQIRKSTPQVKLLVVGDHSGNEALRKYHSKLLALVKELGQQNHVIFTGRVDDLPAHYHLADVYVTASQHEGFGVPLIEAMASGVPVVASNKTAHPWVLGDGGQLVDSDDPVDYAAAVSALLNDSELYGDFVRKGAQRVKEFTLERYETGWFDIIAELTAWMPTKGYARSRSMTNAKVPTEVDVYSYGDMRVGDVLRLASLRDSANAMRQDFQLTSKLPVLGKLIIWIRSNLTSHIRAEYFPLFQSQFSFNREVVSVLYAIQTLLGRRYADQQALMDAQQHSIAALERRVTLLANEIQLMQMRLTLMQSEDKGKVDDQTLTDFQRDLNRLTKSYETLRDSMSTSGNALKADV